jgi:cytidylate kinase
MNSKKDRIILGGPAGSGKTSVGKLLALKLGSEFYSMGNRSREKAKTLGMTLSEYQTYMNSNPEIEKQDDKEFCEEMRNKNSFVLDYRMGFHFLDQATCIYLDIDSIIAASRVKDRVGNGEDFRDKPISEIAIDLIKRNHTLKERYLKLYGVDCTKPTNYDIYLLTNNFSIEQVVSKIMKMLN